jgi:hypothetical protein
VRVGRRLIVVSILAKSKAEIEVETDIENEGENYRISNKNQRKCTINYEQVFSFSFVEI